MQMLFVHPDFDVGDIFYFLRLLDNLLVGLEELRHKLFIKLNILLVGFHEKDKCFTNFW